MAGLVTSSILYSCSKRLRLLCGAVNSTIIRCDMSTHLTATPNLSPHFRYMFPRFLLSHHFWTPQQKEEFLRLKLKHQVHHYHKILSLMERKMLSVPSQEGRLALQKVLRKVIQIFSVLNGAIHRVGWEILHHS